MSSTFNPYASWFNIDTGSQSPDNYQLLGLRHFESNASNIESAVQNRLEILAHHLSGPHSHLAKRLRYEVHSARDCLLDQQQKHSYDALLRSRLSPTPAQPSRAEPEPIPRAIRSSSQNAKSRPLSSPSASAPSPAAKGDLLDLSLLEQLTGTASPALIQFPNVQPIHRQNKRKRKQSASKVIGIVMAVIPTFATAGILWWWFGNGSKSQDNAKAARPASVFDHAEPASTTVTAPPVQQRPVFKVHEPPKQVPSDVTVQDELELATAEEEPLEHAAVPREQRQIAPLALPQFIDLPAMDERSVDTVVDLFPCDLAEGSDCRLAIASASPEILGSQSAFQVELKAANEGTLRWLVQLVSQSPKAADSFGGRLPVAEFLVRGGQMGFRWLSEGRSAVAQMLRNCLLILKVNGITYSMALRSPQLIPAQPVDLEKSLVAIPLPGAWLPKTTELSLELLELQGFAGSAVVPQRSVKGTSQDLQILVKPDVPQVDLRMRLSTSGGPAVLRVTPLVIDRDQDELPLTLSRLATMKRTLPVALVNARESYSENSGRLRRLQSDYQRVLNTSDAVLQGRKALLLTSLSKDIQKAQVATARSADQISRAEARLAVLPGLQKVADNLHQRASLSFRVYFTVGEKEVDILRAE